MTIVLAQQDRIVSLEDRLQIGVEGTDICEVSSCLNDNPRSRFGSWPDLNATNVNYPTLAGCVVRVG
jgi:hypothetical protein